MNQLTANLRLISAVIILFVCVAICQRLPRSEIYALDAVESHIRYGAVDTLTLT